MSTANPVKARDPNPWLAEEAATGTAVGAGVCPEGIWPTANREATVVVVVVPVAELLAMAGGLVGVVSASVVAGRSGTVVVATAATVLGDVMVVDDPPVVDVTVVVALEQADVWPVVEAMRVRAPPE